MKAVTPEEFAQQIFEIGMAANVCPELGRTTLIWRLPLTRQFCIEELVPIGVVVGGRNIRVIDQTIRVDICFEECNIDLDLAKDHLEYLKNKELFDMTMGACDPYEPTPRIIKPDDLGGLLTPDTLAKLFKDNICLSNKTEKLKLLAHAYFGCLNVTTTKRD
ncbi:hypothetical protein CZP2022_104 [Vibrio phage C-ZP2022]|nr:hypothetical protein CZP2022_104 [Vibrio phage C-ZP2022]